MDLERFLENVPPAPPVISKIIHMSEDDRYSAKDIAKTISLDPVLVGDVLRIANSPFYGIRRKITSLEEAVVVMGVKALVRTAIASWGKRFQEREVSAYKMKRGELALFSLVGAYAAVEFGKRGGLGFIHDVIFTAGVLRTIGRVVIAEVLKGKIELIVKHMVEKKVDFLEAEKLVVGMNHAEVGYIIAKKWGIPEEISLVVRYYANPSEFSGDLNIKKIVCAVHLGDAVAQMLGIFNPLDGLLHKYDKTSLSVLNLKEDDFQLVLEDVQETLSKVKDEINLIFS